MACGDVVLPSLARLARWNWWAVVVSVPLLTLGLGSGVELGLRSQKAGAALSFSDPIVIGHGVVWLAMMSLFVWLLTTRRSTSKQVAALTLWAGGFLLVILLGLQVLSGGGLSSFHSGAKVSALDGNWKLKIENWKLKIESREHLVRSPISNFQFPISNFQSPLPYSPTIGGST